MRGHHMCGGRRALLTTGGTKLLGKLPQRVLLGVTL